MWLQVVWSAWLSTLGHAPSVMDLADSQNVHNFADSASALVDQFVPVSFQVCLLLLFAATEHVVCRHCLLPLVMPNAVHVFLLYAATVCCYRVAALYFCYCALLMSAAAGQCYCTLIVFCCIAAGALCCYCHLSLVTLCVGCACAQWMLCLCPSA